VSVRRAGRLALAPALAVVLAACGEQARPSPQATGFCCDPTAPAIELTVYAAASLKAAVEEAIEAYSDVDDSVSIVVSTDSSAALETKIEQGAPADVFLAADMANPRKLFDGGWATDVPRVFAGNELSVIVPTDNPGGLTSPADLAKAGVDVIAAGDEVPITKYATRLVENLASVPGYPPGFQAAYSANVVSREENVAAVVGKLELGQGDAAIVYVTDAKASSRVMTLEVPEGANVPATYAGVVVKASNHPGAAGAFLAWLAGPGGQAVLARHGFLAPSS
jgi:molybdate transport system substrate-binding protein